MAAPRVLENCTAENVGKGRFARSKNRLGEVVLVLSMWSRSPSAQIPCRTPKPALWWAFGNAASHTAVPAIGREAYRYSATLGLWTSERLLP